MELTNYLPLNTKESIDLLINDLRSHTIKFSFKEQIRVEIMFNIRKAKLHLYLKKQITGIPDLSNPLNFNDGKK